MNDVEVLSSTGFPSLCIIGDVFADYLGLRQCLRELEIEALESESVQWLQERLDNLSSIAPYVEGLRDREDYTSKTFVYVFNRCHAAIKTRLADLTNSWGFDVKALQ
jgi:hypothetical protein